MEPVLSCEVEEGALGLLPLTCCVTLANPTPSLGLRQTQPLSLRIQSEVCGKTAFSCHPGLGLEDRGGGSPRTLSILGGDGPPRVWQRRAGDGGMGAL